MTQSVWFSLLVASALGFSASARDLVKGDLDSPIKGGHAKYSVRKADITGSSDGQPHPMECYNSTPNELSRELSVELCAAAVSSAPADCYRATPSDLSPEMSVKLCKHAESVSPADCYINTPSDLSKELSVQLCSARTVD